MGYQFLTLEKHANIWTLKLKREEVFNALNAGLIHEIRDVAEKAQISDEMRVLVITGIGKAFCSGADLKAGLVDPDLGNVLRETYNPMILALRNLEKPIIAAVNGPAAGAGCSLALACDVIIAKESAYFSELFVQIGLTLDAGSTAFLMQTVGYHKAFEIASSGRKISAEEAKQLGWVMEVIQDVDWEERVKQIAQDYANKPTRALALMKAAFQKVGTLNLEKALELEAECQSIAGQTSDFSEGVMAFLQKRIPVYSGK
ncbi:enoyl-CoA hydratase/isomerase family protein [Aquirufa sp. ROCK-SH2]